MTVCIYRYIYTHVVFMTVCIYIYIYTLFSCLYVYIDIYTHTLFSWLYVYIYIYTYTHVVFMTVCIYRYIHTYTLCSWLYVYIDTHTLQLYMITQLSSFPTRDSNRPSPVCNPQDVPRFLNLYSVRTSESLYCSLESAYIFSFLLRNICFVSIFWWEITLKMQVVQCCMTVLHQGFVIVYM